MEEIKVGTYIRTKEGLIFQIIGQCKRVDHTLYDTDNFGICSSTVLEEITKKQSKDINDLIEEGDLAVMNCYLKVKKFITRDDIIELKLGNFELLEILTKEQFNSMKYIVGDE